jgi:predicted acylesterase/phospholipase RssA
LQDSANQKDAGTKPLRVLSLDGGGMRGIYSAAYLNALLNLFERERKEGQLDLGAGFDLIVGTSTGAIIACAAAKGEPMSRVVDLYKEHGPKIFPIRLHGDIRLLLQLFTRPYHLKRGAEALRSALMGVLGDTTFADLYADRGIALSIPAIEMSQENSWVFKTKHWGGIRDEDVTLVDACMASSAAPIFRSLAAIDATDGVAGHKVFADGGLWANNPVLVGLLDALKIDPSRPIQLFCVGNIPRPAGEHLGKHQLDRGLLGWKMGGRAAELSISAQEFAFDNMARMFAQVVSDLGRKVDIVRFPTGTAIPSLVKYLGIDDARDEAMDALIGQGRADANLTKSICDDPANEKGRIIRSLFSNLPIRE